MFNPQVPPGQPIRQFAVFMTVYGYLRKFSGDNNGGNLDFSFLIVLMYRKANDMPKGLQK